jgi:hypothetical protein
VILAGFWSFAWHPRLAEHLSSKAMFETYKELRKPGDQLVILGELGHAPFAYADAPRGKNAKPDDLGYEKAMSRDVLVAALKRDNRVFAIAPQSELCSLHREVGDKPYFVIDDRNTRNLLFSNKVTGAGFVEEALDDALLFGHLGQEDLDGGLAAEELVLAEPHGAHAAGAEPRHDPVATEHLADHVTTLALVEEVIESELTEADRSIFGPHDLEVEADVEDVQDFQRR